MMLSFLDLRAWFDELSEEERLPIEALRAAALGAGTRLLPLDHGTDIVQQLAAAKKRFLACKDPFCLIRIGDCEIGLLSAGALPIKHGLDTQFRFAGLSREALPLRRDFISAVQEAPLVGLQKNWPEICLKTGMLLFMLGLEVPLSRGVEVHLPYTLLVDGTLFGYLAGKKVLLVGASARRLADCLGLKGFLDAYGFLGPMEKMKIAGVIETRTREAGGAWADYERVIREAAAIDYDVALLACGAMAKPLAWRLWKTGKTALDVGFVFDVLMGNPERMHRPVLKDVVWPKFP
jgi:hypothetical protein